MINKTKLKKKPNKKVSKKEIQIENSLALYLTEIDREKLLTKDEEKRLAKLSQDGNRDAREKLIKSNLRFVVSVAKKYQNRGLPLIDLINEGNLGLITAAEKFDYTKGYHFISYAVWWIKQSILKALSEKTRLVRLPLNRANQLHRFQRYKKETDPSGAKIISNKELSTVFGVDVKSVNAIINASNYTSLDAPIKSDKRERCLRDIIQDENFYKPEKKAFDNALRESLFKAFEVLSEQEKSVIQHRYGLNGKKGKTLREIGIMFSLTKERIRQIEKKAIKKLKYNSGTTFLKEYLIH